MSFDAKDPKWAGLEPIKCPQTKGYPFYIHYGGEYGAAMEIFRSLMNANEYSQRALDITSFLMEYSVTNPCTFYYRQKILEKIGFDFDKELLKNSQLLLTHLKPYQLWIHRKWIVEHLPEGRELDETQFIKQILFEDRKNFHAWTYLSWFAEKFNKWEWLFDITTSQLEDDVFNNSAWAMRNTVLQKMNKSPSDDLEFALDHFSRSPISQSCGSYIKGLLDLDFSLAAAVKTAIDANLNGDIKTTPALILASQIAEKEGNIALYDTYIEELEKVDSMRAHFWSLMKSSSKRFA